MGHTTLCGYTQNGGVEPRVWRGMGTGPLIHRFHMMSQSNRNNHLVGKREVLPHYCWISHLKLTSLQSSCWVSDVSLSPHIVHTPNINTHTASLSFSLSLSHTHTHTHTARQMSEFSRSPILLSASAPKMPFWSGQSLWYFSRLQQSKNSEC